MEIDACGDMNPYGSSAQEAYKYLTYWQFKKLVICAFRSLFVLECFLIFNKKQSQAIPNAFANGIEGLGVNPIVLTIKK